MSINAEQLLSFAVDVQDFGDGIAREYRCSITAQHDGRFQNMYCERGSLRARAGYGVNRFFVFDSYEQAQRHAMRWAKRAKVTP
jgi:hypothetical protein